MTDNSNRNLPLQIVIATTCITLAAALRLGQSEVVAATAFAVNAAVAAAMLTVLALAIAFWHQARHRAVRRWEAALNAYAEREIARENRWKELKRAQTFSTATGISEKVIHSKNRDFLTG